MVKKNNNKKDFLLLQTQELLKMMILSLVAMTGLEKCCITFAYMQWLTPMSEPLLVCLLFGGCWRGVFIMSPPFRVGRHIVFPPASVTKSCLLYNLKTVQAISTKLHINISKC